MLPSSRGTFPCRLGTTLIIHVQIWKLFMWTIRLWRNWASSWSVWGSSFLFCSVNAFADKPVHLRAHLLAVVASEGDHSITGFWLSTWTISPCLQPECSADGNNVVVIIRLSCRVQLNYHHHECSSVSCCACFGFRCWWHILFLRSALKVSVVGPWVSGGSNYEPRWWPHVSTSAVGHVRVACSCFCLRAGDVPAPACAAVAAAVAMAWLERAVSWQRMLLQPSSIRKKIFSIISYKLRMHCFSFVASVEIRGQRRKREETVEGRERELQH